MKKENKVIMSGKEREKRDKRKLRIKRIKALIFCVIWGFCILLFMYGRTSGTRIDDVQKWLHYAVNGFKYVPEKLSDEERESKIGFYGIESEPAQRSDGHLFGYGEKQLDFYGVSEEEISAIESAGKACDKYGHYSKVDARDLMDEFYTRCKAKGVDIMYASEKGRADVSIDEGKYDLTSVFLLSLDTNSRVEIEWDLGDDSIRSINVISDYGDKKYFDTQLRDEDSEMWIAIDTMLDLLNDNDLNEYGHDVIEQYMASYTRLGEKKGWRWANRNDNFAYVGDWMLAVRYEEENIDMIKLNMEFE